MGDQTNKYIREVLHAQERPPSIPIRFFYTSPLAIDDPLSPLPPPLSGSATIQRQPPRPFSDYDNGALEKTWLELRTEILKYNEDGGEKGPRERVGGASGSGHGRSGSEARRRASFEAEGKQRADLKQHTPAKTSRTLGNGLGSPVDTSEGESEPAWKPVTLSSSLRALDSADIGIGGDVTVTTGNPFVRAPSRTMTNAPGSKTRPGKSRPIVQLADSYDWGDGPIGGNEEHDCDGASTSRDTRRAGPLARVPVGVSRLHEVVMPTLHMEPIYWSPVNDIASVVRGTWFYKDSMLPVEVEVANMLEAGYITLQPWTETWRDELNSAVEVGALGEMKISHNLWPEKPLKQDSRPTTSRDNQAVQNTLVEEVYSPEQQRREIVESAEDLIDISIGLEGLDNKASGTTSYGRDGRLRHYPGAAVIYANDKEAYLLRPSLQPSAYYGRRPLANYIRKGHKIGVCVVRGFDQTAWEKLHPPRMGPRMTKAQEGVSTSQHGILPNQRQKSDPALALSERPQVTDLVLVIHGIGQKLSERVESFHFTHAINAFRREINVELGTNSVKDHMRKDMGGIMVLPVNWRLSLSFEDGGYRDECDDPSFNQYSLKDITPETLPYVRNIISDVMLDIPYYLSQEHNPKMIAACVGEANRIYHLWCNNNPGFAQWGRVHLIAHSLGSVMAIDILSKQPSYVPRGLRDPSDGPKDHFNFDTSSLFVCGSPVGFFLLLKKAALLPRSDRQKPGLEPGPPGLGVAGVKDTYGCIAVDNIYNIINPYDPVAYRLNAAVDASYSAALKPAIVPSASKSWIPSLNIFRASGVSSNTSSSQSHTMPSKPTRLPSNVELETHNFSREEVAEERAIRLNDNGQIDWFLRYGGGTFDIQYLTMLGAHSSYWINRDFVRMIVVEVGREGGRDGTVPIMRAVKRKGGVGA